MRPLIEYPGSCRAQSGAGVAELVHAEVWQILERELMRVDARSTPTTTRVRSVLTRAKALGRTPRRLPPPARTALVRKCGQDYCSFVCQTEASSLRLKADENEVGFCFSVPHDPAMMAKIPSPLHFGNATQMPCAGNIEMREAPSGFLGIRECGWLPPIRRSRSSSGGAELRLLLWGP